MPYTVAQLEAFVSSAHYDAHTAAAIARGIPALPRLKGEQISPGVTRIHGNLCNVHGKYGPCDAALSGKKKPKKGRGRKPAKTDAQRAAERAQRQDARTQETTRQQALNMTKVGEATGLEDHLANLDQFSQGKPIRPQDEETLVAQGLMERGADGSARVSEQGRVLVNAAKRGDVQRARDAMSRGRDQVARRSDHAKRQQDTAGRRAANQIGRELTRRQRADAAAKKRAAAAAKKPSKASGKKPEKTPVEKPRKPVKRIARSQAPHAPALSNSPAKPKPAAPAPEKAPAKQIAPALTEAAQNLSDGKELSEADTLSLIRNGLARLVKGELVLTAAGQRQTMKSFRIFKDATGRDRWVAQSSTAFQDRDREIVSTKALADDCAFADATGSYGPLRWWHTPGLDLGDCDFNAMHGRVLIESGTFRSPAIAQKVAAAAPGLEISLGFVHLPSEPDADGVFHHIRRFERSLVPRGKASNRFTAFTVKETRMFDPTKVAALKTLGFSDDDITGLQAQAEATEKSAADQGVAFKADEPTPPEEITIGGVVYTVKAFPPVEEATDSVVEEDAIGDMPMEEEPVDENALTLSAGDLAAIQGMIAQVMGALELEKKVAGHVQGLMAPYQATKDASDAEAKAKIAELTQSAAALKAQIAELTGDQPAAPYRASQAKDNVLTDATMLAAAKQLADPNANDPWADIKMGLGLSRPQ